MDSTNTFSSLKAMFKDTYSKKKKVAKKATSELDASRNPMKFAKDNIEPSLKGKKGIAS